MDYTTQIEIIIEIKTLLLKHVFAIYDNEDTTFENPAHKEMKSIKGYEIIYHDIDKLPYSLNNYQNLTFTIEGKTCALMNFTDAQKNEFYQWTNGCILPNSVKLCEFIDNKIFEENINFESKDRFQAILNDFFENEHYKNRDLMRQLREVSKSVPIPTPPHQAEGKTNNRTIEKNKRYLDITTMYYTQMDNGERINTSKKNTMTKNEISEDTFKRALKENIEILRTKGRENDFKWLKIN